MRVFSSLRFPSREVCLGSSLTQSPWLPEMVGRRSLNGECLGLVIVGLQQTPLDHVAALRIFSDLDTFLKILLDKLELSINARVDMSRTIVHCVTVPYTVNGERSGDHEVEFDESAGSVRGMLIEEVPDELIDGVHKVA